MGTFDFLFGRGRKNAQPANITVKETSSATSPPTMIYVGTDTLLGTEWNESEAISDGLKSNVYVFACIRLVSDLVGEVPFKVMRRTGYDNSGKPKWEWQSDHPLQWVLDWPNKRQTGTVLRQRMSMHLDLAGNSLVHKTIVNGKTRNLNVLQPDGYKPVSDDNVSISYYEQYTSVNSGYGTKYDTDVIIHAMLEDPANPFWGFSPLEAAQVTINAATAAVRWNYNQIKNGANPGLAFVYENALTKEQKDAAAAMITAGVGPNSAGLPMISSGKMSIKEFGRTPMEMDFVRSNVNYVRAICTAFKVPAEVFVSDKRENDYKTAMEDLWRKAVRPRCKDIADALTLQLAIDFAEDKRNPELKIVPDFSGIEYLSGIDDAKASAFQKLFRNGVPVNMAADAMLMDLPYIEGGDVPYKTGNLEALDVNERMKQEGAAEGISILGSVQDMIDDGILIEGDEGAE